MEHEMIAPIPLPVAKTFTLLNPGEMGAAPVFPFSEQHPTWNLAKGIRP